MFTLELKGEPRRPIVLHGDPSADVMWMALLAEAMDQLREAGGVEFVVSGFGQKKWPLDLIDLLDFLTQLEYVAGPLSRGEPSVLGFFEQGLAREIEIIPQGSMLHLECKNYEGDWIPEPATCLMERSALLGQLDALVDRFISMLSGDIAELVAWRQRIRLG